MKAILRALLCCILILAGTRSTLALIIVRTNAASLAANLSAADVTNAMNAFDYAASQFSSRYTNAIQVNITLAAVAGTSTLGGSTTRLNGFFTYNQIRNALISRMTSPDDNTSLTNLPVVDPTGAKGWVTSRAQAKALGLIASDASNDGTFTFGAGFAYTYEPTNRAVSGKYDFIGVSMHEITEIMGRIPALGVNFGDGGPDYIPFDLFRFTGVGVRGLTNGPGVYFSINNGVTNLKGYNNAANNGGDAQDWASGANDTFNAFSSSGVLNALTPVGIQAMDVIGYNLNPPSLIINPGSLTFGSLNIGQSSTQNFSVINIGLYASTGSVSVASPFAITAGTPYNVTAGQTGTVSVSFSPGAGGAFSTNAVFIGNAGISSNAVAGTGTSTQPDLSLTASAAPSPVPQGQNLTYSLTLTNLTGNTASSVTVTDTLPPTVTFISATSGCQTDATGKVVCDFGTFAGNANTNFAIVAFPNVTGTIINTAIVYTATAEITLTNNLAATTTVVAPCSYALAPGTNTLSANGGPTNTTVTASSGTCPWTATTADAWLSITSPLPGVTNLGTGLVSYTVAATSTGARTGTVTAAGIAHTVIQTGCGFNISTNQTTVVISGVGLTNFTVNASGTGCTWTASTVDSWITNLDPPAGTGTLSVTFGVLANSGTSRTGTVTAAGLTHTIIQPGCTYTLTPGTNSFPVTGGGPSNLTITAAGSCPWTASTAVGWINISSPLPGDTNFGSGSVSYTVTGNSGSGRTGTVLAAGQTHIVIEAGCSFSLTTNAASFAAAGGSSNVIVNANGSSCTWTSFTNNAFLTITAGTNGTGNGTVSYTVATNPTFVTRTGSLTVAGLTYTINQAAATRTNSWLFAGSGKWETAPNWSASVPPDNTFSATVITNAGNNTVTIDDSTASGAPASMTISNLLVSKNTLRLTNSAPTTFSVLNSLVLTNGGALALSNAVAKVSGSQLTQGGLIVGNSFAATSSVWVVDSTLIVTNGSGPKVLIGDEGAGQMTVSSGLVRADSFYIGTALVLTDPHGVGTFTVAGGTNIFTGVFLVGSAGQGTMWVTGGQVVLTNANTTVGNFDPGQLTVSNGTVAFGNVTLGANGGSGVLKLAGGTIVNAPLPAGGNTNGAPTSQLMLGRSAGDTGTVWVTGGQMLLSNTIIIVGGNGLGRMIVSNGTVVADALRLGTNANARGELTIVGGTVTILSGLTNLLRVGDSAGATGLVVMSNGALDATHSTFVVGSGGAGQMIISNGALQMGGAIVGANSGSSNSLLQLVGGTTTVSNPTNPATLEVRLGTMALAGATAQVDSLLVTNGSASHFQFSTGILSVRGTTISNNAAQVVGDGVQGATWHLDGGVHTFANGLIISTNAQLTGCGTIDGSVLNQGTLLADCGGTLSFSGIITNFGIIVATNGTYLNFTAPVVNFGTIVASAGNAGFYGGLVNSGTTLNPNCIPTVTPTNVFVGASGGAGVVSVLSSGCYWTATSDVGWLHDLTPASDTTNNTVSYLVDINLGSIRTGHVFAGGSTHTVIQDTCTYSIDSATNSFLVDGGSSNLTVTTPGGCPWTAGTTNAWISVASAGQTNFATGILSYSVSANSSGPRTGTVIAAGQTHLVLQDGCGFSLSTNATSVIVDGIALTNFLVNASGTACVWTVTLDVPWLVNLAAADGTGTASVAFGVLPNSGIARTGTVTAAGLTHTVVQDGCGFSLDPTNWAFAAFGGTGSITVTTTGTACVWSVDSPAFWITDITPTNGTGNAIITYLVGTNTVESPRTATLTIAGLAHVIDQAPALAPFTQWQLDNFGCTNCAQAAAEADPDGDGQSNLAEFLAGFVPTNGASFFHITSVQPEGADVRVFWLTVGGHTNAVEAATALAGSYTNLSDIIIPPGSGELTTNYLDAGALTNAPMWFYRIRLQP